MKKMFAILAALVMVFAVAVAVAEESALIFPNGITFGLNMDQVVDAVPEKYHEIDNEHTHGPVTFGELEYERVVVNDVPAEVKYLFVGNELVAVRMCFEARNISREQIIADLTGVYGGEAGPVDMALLGNGIYAVDDEGYTEGTAEAIVSGRLMIVVEQEEDDIDVTFVDLDAAYITAQY